MSSVDGLGSTEVFETGEKFEFLGEPREFGSLMERVKVPVQKNLLQGHFEWPVQRKWQWNGLFKEEAYGELSAEEAFWRNKAVQKLPGGLNVVLCCRHNGEETSPSDIIEHILNAEFGSAARDIWESEAFHDAVQRVGEEVAKND
jgi:hypothetical protein